MEDQKKETITDIIIEVNYNIFSTLYYTFVNILSSATLPCLLCCCYKCCSRAYLAHRLTNMHKI